MPVHIFFVILCLYAAISERLQLFGCHKRQIVAISDRCQSRNLFCCRHCQYTIIECMKLIFQISPEEIELKTSFFRRKVFYAELQCIAAYIPLSEREYLKHSTACLKEQHLLHDGVTTRIQFSQHSAILLLPLAAVLKIRQCCGKGKLIQTLSTADYHVTTPMNSLTFNEMASHP